MMTRNGEVAVDMVVRVAPSREKCIVGRAGRLPECNFGDVRCRYVTLTPTDDCAAEGRL